ncbi:hypothetical protein AURDEDRAFT_167757 [Auricularia subglabra TFB-10046 SS5]|nr:hypothetical protein AURDEDRAFT_167757 [Auricularia subglabra TFB-10046 SS5]
MSYFSLSDDLVLNVLDYLDFRGVFAYSHISRHCRILARSHPTYWQTLSLSDSVTHGELELFLERLATKRTSDATLTLTLKWVALRNDFSELVLPALRANLHRVAILTVVISSNAPEQLWDLFKLSTPQLRRLKVLVTGQVLAARPLPSIFDVHVHRRLESVVFIDAALPSDLVPLAHSLKDVTVFSTIRPLDLRRILDWAPRTAALGLWRLNVSSLPSQHLCPSQHQYSTSATHISLHGSGWLSVLQSLTAPEALPSLTIRVGLPNPCDINSALPSAMGLCVCVKEQRDPRAGFGQLRSGVVAITTPNRDVLRVFENIYLGYMVSDLFIGHFVPHYRIETLVISLNLGFVEMCHRGYSFPHLRTLCLGLSSLPELPACWEEGSITCPGLHTLAFQQEYDRYTAAVSSRAIQSFVLNALKRDATANLRLVLKATSASTLARIWKLEIQLPHPHVHGMVRYIDYR